MSVYTYGTRNHTLGDKVYESMILFRSKVPELDGNIDSVVLSLEKMHHPLEERLQQIKALQCTCIDAFHSYDSLLTQIKGVFTECITLETITYPLDDVYGFSFNDKQRFYDFCQKIRLLQSNYETLHEKLEDLTNEANTLSNLATDSVAFMDETKDRLTKVIDTFEELLNEIEED